MITKSSIAGINTKVDCDNKRLFKNLEAFRYDYRGEPDVTVKITDLELKNFCTKYTGYDRDAALLRLSAECFLNALPEFGGFGLKAATVSFGEQTFVIAAESEQEKHRYVEDLLSCGNRATVIDDAYAVVIKDDTGIFVYGTPWAKTPVNTKKELSGIILPSDCTGIRSAERKEAIDRMMICLTLPKRPEQLVSVLARIDGVGDLVPVMVTPVTDPAAFYSYVEFGFSG